MGFGHRVYKNFDPRATIIREMCHKVLGKLGQSDNPLFELALRLEEVALKDDYFISRKLYPNVDFYSGIIYRALGIPREMFTVMFAIARTAGWVAHWSEMIADPEMKIARPRQLYTGADAARLRPGQEALIKGDRAHLPFRRARLKRCAPFQSTLDLGERRAAHRPAVHRAGRRLADAVLAGRSSRPPRGCPQRSARRGRPRPRRAACGNAAPRTSCGMPRSIRRTATFSGVSAKRCSVMSLCAVAVPDSSGPTSRGSNSSSSRIASSASAAHLGQLARVLLRHEQALVLGERLLDLGVLRQHGEVGDAEALRGLALGEAVVLVPVLDHEPRGLARDGLAHHVAADRSLAPSEDRLFVSLRRRLAARRLRPRRPPAGGRRGSTRTRPAPPRRARSESAEMRAVTTPSGIGSRVLRHAGERLAHEVDPHRQRRARAFLVAAERPLLVEADPGGRDEVRR